MNNKSHNDKFDKFRDEFIKLLKALPVMMGKEKEIEVRFGKYNGRFMPGLSKKQFDKLLIIFQKSDIWTDIINVTSTDYYDGNVRLNHSEHGYVCSEKYRLGSYEFELDNNNTFDIRLSISEEVNKDIPECVSNNEIPSEITTWTHVRHKQRFTFIYQDMLLYELTVINSKTYEFELELIKPFILIQKYTHEYIVDTIINIINDMNVLLQD